MQWFISTRMRAADRQPLLLYTRIGAWAPAPVFPHSSHTGQLLTVQPSENTDPARKYSEIPVLGVADDPIQFGLPVDANANLAARVQA